MTWYVVHVGHVPRIYRTWEECNAQVHGYSGNLHKKYRTEEEALRAFYGWRSANLGHQQALEIEERPALEIEEKPPAGDVKTRTVSPWSWKDAMLLFMAMVIAFLIGKLM
jgi:viroplasmin and RNaseH domain-containing protein